VSRRVDLAELREAAHENGDRRLADMSDRELKAVALENYQEQPDRETVIRTRAVDGGNS
jgi:hypothetical protein